MLLSYYIPQSADCKDSKINGAVADSICFQLPGIGRSEQQEVGSLPSGKTTIFREFRKNRKNGHFFPRSTLKMVGLLQLKLPTSTLAGFLINGVIMNLLQHIFSQAENLVFQFPKSRGRIFLCVSPTFASPIEKPATSAPRRICREIIGNTEGNVKTVDSLRRCKWANSTSKSAQNRKSRPEDRSAENRKNGRPF